MSALTFCHSCRRTPASAPGIRTAQLCRATRGILRPRREGSLGGRRRPPPRFCPASPARRPATPRAAGCGQAPGGPGGLRARELRAPLADKGARGAGQGREAPPRPAGGAVLRGPGRLPLRTEQSCSRAMFPAARRFARGPGGGEAARSSRPGAAAAPLRPHRGPQAASPQAGLRCCGPPSPSLPAAAAQPEPPDGRRLRPRGSASHRPARSRAARRRRTAPRRRAAPPAAAARAPLKWRAPGAPAHLSGERERRVPAAPLRACARPAPPARAPLAPSGPIARRAGRRPRAPGGGAGEGRGGRGRRPAPLGGDPPPPPLEAGAQREPGASLSAAARPRERVRALVASRGKEGPGAAAHRRLAAPADGQRAPTPRPPRTSVQGRKCATQPCSTPRLGQGSADLGTDSGHKGPETVTCRLAPGE